MSQQEPPFFPAPSVRARAAELGYGTGPWSRSELSERWGDAMANKVIAEAKAAGWLVSPFRDQYFVPPAADLAVVPWLSGAQRDEFVLSRSLIASGLRFWSLSAWASTEGLLFSEPVFVTDLTLANPEPAPKDLEPGRDASSGSQRARKRAEAIRSIPFLENLIIVPTLGRLSDVWERSRVRLPDAQDSRARREASWLAPARGIKPVPPNVIEYQITRRMDDAAWLFAFLSALNIPRAREKLRKLGEDEIRASVSRGAKSSKPTDLMDRAVRWGASFGPPSPNENWQAVLASGTYPYLLVPPMIWDESLSLASSRMLDEMTKLRRSLDA